MANLGADRPGSTLDVQMRSDQIDHINRYLNLPVEVGADPLTWNHEIRSMDAHGASAALRMIGEMFIFAATRNK